MEEAERALESLNDVVAYRRENWVELSRILKLEEDIARAVKRPEFEKSFIDEVTKLASKINDI
ncbi:MAG: hypothetical protein ABWW66_07885 [Archaeoglobaceae archaeon]